MQTTRVSVGVALCALFSGACAATGGDPPAAPQRVRAPDAGVPDGPPGLVLPGAVDPTFGQQGIAALPRPGVEPRDMLVTPDGKIVIVGSLFADDETHFEGYVFRYLPDGSL